MIEEMSLRPTTASDHKLISNLLAATYPVLMRVGYHDDLLRKALPIMTKANPALLSSGTFYVSQGARGQSLGCGGWTFERPGRGEVEPGLAHIRHFATHPERTSRGVGRSIYEHCERTARLAGVERFECYSSLNAEGFYRSLGFKVVEHFDVRLGPDLSFPSVRMMRPDLVG